MSRPVGLLGVQRKTTSGFFSSRQARNPSSRRKPFSCRRGYRSTRQPHRSAARAYSEKVGAVSRAVRGFTASP